MLSIGLRLVGCGSIIVFLNVSDLRAKPPTECLQWNERTPLFPNLANPDSRIVFDRARRVLVHFDGQFVWEGDGLSWKQIDAHGPLWREGFELAYDERRRKTILFGGSLNGSVDPSAIFADTWAWDGTAWTRVSETGPPGRFGHSMVYDSKREVVVLFGGSNQAKLFGDTWEWGGHQWAHRSDEGPQAQAGALITFDRRLARAVLLPAWHSQYEYGDDTWQWDGTSWTRFAAAPAWPYSRNSIAYDEQRDITVLLTEGECQPDSCDDYHALTWEWDGVSWIQFNSANSPITAWGSLVFDKGKGSLVFFVSSALGFTDQEVWARRDGDWERIGASGPSRRTLTAMTYDNWRQETVLFSGYDAYAGDTWAWDGSKWALHDLGGAPERNGSALAFDSRRGVAVMFGGRGHDTTAWGLPKGDTWEWNGTNWTFRTNVGPPPRLGHGMAFDSKRGVVVLFGGTGWGGALGDTWEWDGTTWALRATDGPSLRTGLGLAYDSSRGLTVLFGGYSYGDPDPSQWVLGDTWEWDGAAWTLRTTTGPSPRGFTAMVYDSARRTCILFGGTDSFSSYGLDDTWTWDGDRWKKIAIRGPWPRSYHVMAYDCRRKTTVLFGGQYSRNDIWELAPAPLWGDSDADCDVDLADFAAFQCCFGARSHRRECHAFDTDDQREVGLSDLAALIEVMASPGGPAK